MAVHDATCFRGWVQPVWEQKNNYEDNHGRVNSSHIIFDGPIDRWYNEDICQAITQSDWDSETWEEHCFLCCLLDMFNFNIIWYRIEQPLLSGQLPKENK